MLSTLYDDSFTIRFSFSHTLGRTGQYVRSYAGNRSVLTMSIIGSICSLCKFIIQSSPAMKPCCQNLWIIWDSQLFNKCLNYNSKIKYCLQPSWSFCHGCTVIMFISNEEQEHSVIVALSPCAWFYCTENICRCSGFMRFQLRITFYNIRSNRYELCCALVGNMHL